MIEPKKKLKRSKALDIYKALLLPRRIEERMLKLLRQNRISKWFSGIGQEAVAVGVTLASEKNDYILPMHRNLGVFTTREVPFYELFCQLFGKADGFSKGRERSFHFGVMDYNIVGMISHLAAMMPVADGLALAKKLKGEQAVAFSFCGDGATSEGDFHEAINLAAVWKLPVVFIIENNGYGLSTPSNEQYACEHLSDRAKGYGIHGYHIDGNNVLEVIDTMKDARKRALKEGPVLIEAKTFRMRGHEEASGTAYVPDDMFEEWSKKDPIMRFEKYMETHHMHTKEEFAEIQNEVDAMFMPDLERALNAAEPEFDLETEMKAVYAEEEPVVPKASDHKGSSSEKRFVDVIQSSLRQAFAEDDKLMIMGQDIAGYGGVFKITEGFLDRFGADRIRNTPIIESGVLGAAVGLALEGFKPVVEMQFSDFVSCGMNQIIQNIAKSRYRWSPPLNITIRMPHGAGVGAGPFHSQSPEGWFMPHAGLKIVVPGTVEDAQNLMYSSLFDPNPVLFFEHKKLYRSLRATTPDHAVYEPLGKAKIQRAGTDATIITYGYGVQWAFELADEYKKQGVSLEILDLRCLAPLDKEAIYQSVQKTGRVLLLQEPSITMGPMSEVSALINEHCFEYLDAPVLRAAPIDTPIPFNKKLEVGYLNLDEMKEKVEKLLGY
ncbi:MAG: dehydrogenase [Balneolaceae bacterium]|nr:dehydrogenase [Balneolaceae bacterium]